MQQVNILISDTANIISNVTDCMHKEVGREEGVGWVVETGGHWAARRGLYSINRNIDSDFKFSDLAIALRLSNQPTPLSIHLYNRHGFLYMQYSNRQFKIQSTAFFEQTAKYNVHQ